MMFRFIGELPSRFRNLNISVDIDTLLLPHFDCNDKTTTKRVISINLYKLIYAIGTIQSRRFAPSKRQKFLDKADLIENICSNTKDFRVRIKDIRQSHGSEILKTISEDFGVGISVVLAQEFFNIEPSTIKKIPLSNKTKNPDWECQTKNNRIIIVEGKGSIDKYTSNTQLKDARIQKNSRIGNVKIASATLLNESKISTNRFVDPPISPDEMDPNFKNKILRAGHYASVFSFLGQSTLSKYYSQLKNRLLKTITQEEQNDKDVTYFELRDNFSTVNYESHSFSGTFYKIDRERFLFIGIDKKLLSYRGFLEFRDYEEDLEREEENNYHMLFRDGVLIIEIKNILVFSDIIQIDKIKNYQEDITLLDIDDMTEISFEKYILYLLSENNFENIEKSIGIDEKYRADIIGYRNGKRVIFELKLFRSKKVDNINLVINQLNRLLDIKEKSDIVVLITNASIPSKVYSELKSDVVLIGRDELKDILLNKSILLDLMNIR